MFIKCPKCRAEYKMENASVPESGLKMRCHACGEIFKAYPKDLQQDVKISDEPDNVDLSKMFERVSKATNSLFFDSDAPAPTKVRVIHSTIYKNTINYFLMIVALVLMAGILCLLRYDVVRLVPNAEKIFDKLHLQSIYEGTNLQISNVKIEEVVISNLSKLKISGIIDNQTSYEMTVLPLKVIVYDEYGQKLLDTTHYLPQHRTRPHYKLPFAVLINNPTFEKKNIQIKFADNL